MIIENEAPLTGFNQPRYWLGWVAATIGGWVIGYMINAVLISAFNIDVTTAAQSNQPEVTLVSVLGLLSIGLAVGVLQWLILRRTLSATQSPPLSLWIPATTLGFALGVWFGLAFMGLGPGLAQWWIVRRTFAKGTWWPTISAVSWPLGYLAGGAVGGALLSALRSTLLAGLIGTFVTGLIIGALTGAVLLWLLREQRSLSRAAK